MMLAAIDDFPWVWPAAAVGLAAAALGYTWLAIVRGRRRAGAAPGACGQCGYEVRGLAGFACPECGADLRRVGVVAGPAPGVLWLLALALRAEWLRLSGATLALAAVLGIGTYAAGAWLLPHDVYPAYEVVLEPGSQAYRVQLKMASNPYRVLGWRLPAGGPSGTARKPKLVVNLARPGFTFDHNFDLRVDLTTWSCETYRWFMGTAPRPLPVNFSRDELARFFTEKDLPVTAPRVQVELDALMRVIDGCRQGWVQQVAGTAPEFKVTGTTDMSSVQYAGSTPLGPPLLSGGLALWVLVAAAMVLSRMWRLRQKAHPRAGRVPPPAEAATGGVTRTLTVLFSDIKDYTARSATGREEALRLVRRHRELAIPVIERRHGVIVKTMGDGLLATFETATDAVLAGLEVQAAATGAAPPGEELELRIAVASGEVLVEAEDVYGPTVNLAARLQGVAKPGQVVVSAATRALLSEREVRVEMAGEFPLAGFAGTVEVFVARESGQRSAVSGQKESGGSKVAG